MVFQMSQKLVKRHDNTVHVSTSSHNEYYR